MITTPVEPSVPPDAPPPGAPAPARGSLLARIINHLRNQHWTAIGIEFVVVVFGVFLGFQLTSWNETRIEREQERDLLVRLYEDIEESISGQTRDLRFLDQQLADQRMMLASLDVCKLAPENEVAFQRGVTTLGYINPPRLYRRTVDELAGAGRTAILQNEELMAELASIVALVEWRAAGFDQTARNVEHHRFIVEDEIRYDPEHSHPDEFLVSNIGVNVDIATLCKMPSVASAISAVSMHTRNRRMAYQPILDRYQAFLPVIAKELDSRWGVHVGNAPAD